MKNMKSSVFRYNPAGLLLFLASIPFLFHACMKDEDFSNLHYPQYAPEIAAPLVSAKLTIADLLDKTGEQEFLKIDEDGFLTLFYHNKLLTESAVDVIEFGDQDVDTTVNIMFPVSLPDGDSLTLSYSFNQKFSNAFDDVVDSIRFVDGNFTISVESDMDHDSKLIITSPYITKNGIPFRKEIALDYNNILPVSRTINFSLNGYTLIFDHSANQNDLRFFFDLRLYGDNNPNPGPYNIQLSIEQTDLRYSAMFGIIKTRSLELLYDKIDLDIFKNSVGGDFHINDPKITLIFDNSFGLPVSIMVDPLKGTSDVNPPYEVEMVGPGISSPFILQAPNYSQVGESVETALYLDKINSNIDDFLNLLPSVIEYGVEAIVNPTGVVPENFVLDTSKISVSIEIEIPLEGYASGFTLQDTIEFSLDEDLDIIDWILFRINAESTFPVEAALQVTFLDSLYNPLDSLFDVAQVIVPAAVPGPPPLYRTDVPTFRNIDIELGPNKLENIDKEVRYIFLTATLNTSCCPNQVVRIYTDNYIKMKLGVRSKFKNIL